MRGKLIKKTSEVSQEINLATFEQINSPPFIRYVDNLLIFKFLCIEGVGVGVIVGDGVGEIPCVKNNTSVLTQLPILDDGVGVGLIEIDGVGVKLGVIEIDGVGVKLGVIEIDGVGEGVGVGSHGHNIGFEFHDSTFPDIKNLPLGLRYVSESAQAQNVNLVPSFSKVRVIRLFSDNGPLKQSL
jgi:hypothetical protein